ncbi:hypothetical protein RNJ44_04931 [Nakaseomyces bracarensis]|uniref:Uncharacterized protein n=1 Tax=Nakaseomyces bracarensis TaxID=273131 RepID=A0ABR4NWC9_9SACH
MLTRFKPIRALTRNGYRIAGLASPPILRTVTPLSIMSRKIHICTHKTNTTAINMIQRVRKLEIRREFHYTPQRSLKFSFSKQSKDNSQTVTKIYKIPTTLLILSTIGGFFLVFTLLPILFTLGFPFLIGMIAFFQFRRWKTNQLYLKMADALLSSSIQMKNSQLMSLKFRLIEKGLPMLTTFTNPTKLMLSNNGEKLLRLLQLRVQNAFENNEKNICSSFIPKEHHFSQYELVLSTNLFKSYTKKLPHDQDIGLMALTLFLRPKKRRNIHVATMTPPELNYGRKIAHVYFVYQGATARGLLNTEILLDAAKAGVDLQEIQSTSPFLISIVPLDSWMPSQYIIKDTGSIGSFDIPFTDNSENSGREFIVRKKS